jgi:hypothetical protein
MSTPKPDSETTPLISLYIPPRRSDNVKDWNKMLSRFLPLVLLNTPTIILLAIISQRGRGNWAIPRNQTPNLFVASIVCRRNLPAVPITIHLLILVKQVLFSFVVNVGQLGSRFRERHGWLLLMCHPIASLLLFVASADLLRSEMPWSTGHPPFDPRVKWALLFMLLDM